MYGATAIGRLEVEVGGGKTQIEFLDFCPKSITILVSENYLIGEKFENFTVTYLD